MVDGPFQRHDCFRSIRNWEHFAYGMLVDAIKEQWNSHRIRPARHHNRVSGIPHVMYHLPERFGAVDCKCMVRHQKIEEMEQHVQYDTELEASEEYRDYFNYVLENEDLNLP